MDAFVGPTWTHSVWVNQLYTGSGK